MFTCVHILERVGLSVFKNAYFVNLKAAGCWSLPGRKILFQTVYKKTILN